MQSINSQTVPTMDENNTAMLQYASAVPGPICVRVRDPEGNEEELEISSAFAVIGRSKDSQICLSDQRVSFRHALLQAIGNHICCIVQNGSIEHLIDFHSRRVVDYQLLNQGQASGPQT